MLLVSPVSRLINYIYDTIYYHLFAARKNDIVNPEINLIISALNDKSYFIYENYLSELELDEYKKDCENAFNTRVNIDELEEFVEYNMVHKKIRWPGIDESVCCARKYKNNKFIEEVALYFHKEKTKVLKTTFEKKEHNRPPEGGGLSKIELGDHLWHIDRPFAVLKTMLLLSDVNDEDGSLEIIAGSYKPFSHGLIGFIHWFKIFLFYFCFNFGYGPYAEPEKLSNHFNEKNRVRLKGKAGDLIFVNTGAWHRGSELKTNGYREVLWNYIYCQNRLSRINILRRILGRKSLN